MTHAVLSNSPRPTPSGKKHPSTHASSTPKIRERGYPLFALQTRQPRQPWEFLGTHRPPCSVQRPAPGSLSLSCDGQVLGLSRRPALASESSSAIRTSRTVIRQPSPSRRPPRQPSSPSSPPPSEDSTIYPQVFKLRRPSLKGTLPSRIIILLAPTLSHCSLSPPQTPASSHRRYTFKP